MNESVTRMLNSMQLLVVGPKASGKTQIVKRIAGKPFSDKYDPTVVVDLERLEINIDSMLFKGLIFDTSDDRKAESVIAQYYDSAHIIWIIVDLAQPFDVLQKQIRFYQEKIPRGGEIQPVVKIIGNLRQTCALTDDELITLGIDNILSAKLAPDQLIKACLIDDTKELLRTRTNLGVTAPELFATSAASELVRPGTVGRLAAASFSDFLSTTMPPQTAVQEEADLSAPAAASQNVFQR